jgi:hypothetical protein
MKNIIIFLLSGIFFLYQILTRIIKCVFSLWHINSTPSWGLEYGDKKIK